MIFEELSPQARQMLKAMSDNFVLARKARELSQVEMAKAIGISLNSYKALESGEDNYNVLSLVKACDYLGLLLTLAFVAAPQFDVTGQEHRLNKKSMGQK